MNIDNDVLIAEVFNRRPLWDQNHEDHSSRTLTDKLWDEVAAILNVPKDRARLKWRYLRGTYRNVIRKYPPPPLGSDDFATDVPWCYYKPLMFLNGQFRSKKDCPNLMPEPDIDDVGTHLEVGFEESEPLIFDNIETWCTVEDLNSCSPCPQTRKSNLKDDDLQFFRSLLPVLKSTSLEKKFFLKMKIQELVYQEVFNNSSTKDQPTIITLVNSSNNKS